ncbi:hypothetical protein AXF42_Ash006270 [Apostasia shenzhenica]|uniref:Uncharacterized protein n=1 Tax=Apostasia shenzhenica TaxID=1088818 RepID=A0A2I0AYN9_9ASPA|nr:hypothetical protein AXF42_Ash006270 [Apostasia shenzhenica]
MAVVAASSATITTWSQVAMTATWRSIGSGRSQMAVATGFLGGCDGKLTEWMQERMCALALFHVILDWGFSNFQKPPLIDFSFIENHG